MKFKNTITGEWVEATDWQLALKAGDYYCIAQPLVTMPNESDGWDVTLGPTVYGQIITNEPEREEPAYLPGYFLVRTFSQWCPEGEMGGFCIVDATRQLTPAEFEHARSEGWPGDPPSPGEVGGEDETVQLFAIIQKGIAGAPPDDYGLHLTSDLTDAPKPLPDQPWQAGYSFWALSFAAYANYPAVLIHVYYEGPMPPDRERDGINQQIQNVAGQALFGEEWR